MQINALMTGQEMLCMSTGKMPSLVINHQKANCTESQQQVRENKGLVVLIILNLPLGQLECIRQGMIGKLCVVKIPEARYSSHFTFPPSSEAGELQHDPNDLTTTKKTNCFFN